MLKKSIRILAVSGSLRASSSNARLLEAIAGEAGNDISYFIFKGLEGIPAFNDADTVPIEVTVWRQHLREADAVLICSPEYAFGIPGALKNAIDWTVGSGELVNKPLALITAATSGDKAHAAWLDIFKALSADITPERAVLIPHIRAKMDRAGQLTDPVAAAAVHQLLASLCKAATASIG